MIYSLFDYTGNMVRPWKEAGYEVRCLDLQRGDNVLEWSELPDAEIVFAFPPCDHLAVSGARWFKGKGLRKLAEAINLVAHTAELCEAAGCPYMIENPVSTLSTYWRPPDYIFHPHHYTFFEPDDNYVKKTCLWTGGGFVMPEKRSIALHLGLPDDRIHKAPPGPDRANFRSATPMGFARAVYEANTKRAPAGRTASAQVTTTTKGYCRKGTATTKPYHAQRKLQRSIHN